MPLFRRSRQPASSAEGNALLAAATRGDSDAVAKVAAYHAHGATDDDIRSWWNLPRAEREAILHNDETARMALFMHVMEETSDPEAAAQTVFGFHARYGDPEDTTAAAGEDRPLPIVLKDRVNRYVESRMNDPLAFKQELEASTSFNAHVRSKLGIAPETQVHASVHTNFSEKTLQHLRETSAKCSHDDLVALFDTNADVVQGGDLDRAVTVAIDQRARHQTATVCGDDEFRREIGGEILSGYVVGRRLLGTHNRRLIYSQKEHVAENATALINGLDAWVPREVYEVAGPTLSFFEAWTNYHSDFGHFGDLDDRDVAFHLMEICLSTGLYIAVAEAELFA